MLPQTPFLDLTLTGGLGSVVIPAIDIPAIRPEFSANVAIDSFTVPSIPIPQIDLAATTVSVGLGPITVPHLDIPRVPVTLNYLFGSQPGGPLKIGPITGLFNTPIGLTPLALSQIVIGASSSQGTITAFLANLPFSTPVVTIDEIPLLASITGHSEPVDIFPGGLTIPAMNPLSINLSGGTGAVTIPAITIGEIPFDLVAHSTLGPVHILIDLPAVPGFGNTTGAPSSGFFNSGDVNTGAFISGNYSNGAFWRGDYQGLLDFSFPVGPLIPQTHLVHLRETVNLGPIHIDPIHVHIPPLLDIDQTIDLGSFTVAPITVAPIALDYHETFDLGPLVIFPPMNIPATVIESFSTAPGGPAPPPFVIPATSNVFISTVDFATGNNVIGPFSGALAPTTIQLGASGPSFSVLNLSIPPIHIPGLTIPSVPLRIDVDGGIPGFTLFPDGLTFPKIPVHVDAFAGIPDFTIFPNGYTIDPIPLQLNLDLTLGPVHILIDLPAVPGFGNTTGAPSSGFFNSGAGGVSGFGNVGAMVSGGWNQAPSALLGGGSGVFNAGTLHSGVLNFGSGMSGLFNTSVLGLGAPALVSGLGSVGQQLSGLLASGTALHQGLVLNFGLADVGLGNVGLGNVGDFNLGAGNVGGFNVGCSTRVGSTRVWSMRVATTPAVSTRGRPIRAVSTRAVSTRVG